MPIFGGEGWKKNVSVNLRQNTFFSALPYVLLTIKLLFFTWFDLAILFTIGSIINLFPPPHGIKGSTSNTTPSPPSTPRDERVGPSELAKRYTEYVGSYSMSEIFLSEGGREGGGGGWGGREGANTYALAPAFL